jgi:hypothetical protein
MSRPKKQFQPSKEFQDVRSAERQRGVAHLVASGPRVVLEALLEVSKGKPLDDVLRRYRKVAVSTYRMLGADVLPIHAEFEEAFRALGRGERS